jgi:hypothetical protein
LSTSTALRERLNSQRPATTVKEQLLKDLDFNQFRAGPSASDDSEPEPAPSPSADPKKT